LSVHASTDEVIERVRRHFDDVALGLGLRGPLLKRANTYFDLAYFHGEIGLEVLVELADFFIYALVFRSSSDGVVPAEYTDDGGRRQKMHVQHVLDHLGIPHDEEDARLKRLGGSYRNCDEMARCVADLVERAWPHLAARSEQLFPPA